MGLLDDAKRLAGKAGELASDNADKIEGAIDGLAGKVKERAPGKAASVDKAAEKARSLVAKLKKDDEGPPEQPKPGGG